MDAPQRLVRFAEIQKWLMDLVESGWTLEAFNTEDERDEPFKVYICLSCDGQDPEDGVL